MKGMCINPWQESTPPDEGTLLAWMAAEGLHPHGWGNAAGDSYGWHEHPYDKVLYCVRGSIVFHTESGDLPLRPGYRMEIPAGTRHAATVGGDGVRCIEAPR